MHDRTRWGLVALLSATATAGYICRVNITVAGAQLMQEYQLSQVELGRVFGAFGLGYALCQLPGGMLADRWGARRVLAILGWLWVGLTAVQAAAGLGVLGASTAGLLLSLFAFRFLFGMTAAPMYPTAAQGVSMWVPPAAHARANGIVIASVGLGSALAPPLVTAVMTTFGWRMAMLASAVPALVMALVWLRVGVPDLEGQAGAWRSNKSSAALPVGVDHGRSPGAFRLRAERYGETATKLDERSPAVPGSPKAQDVVSGPLELLRRPGFLLLTLSYSLQGYVGYIFVSWFFLYLVQVRQFTLMQSAALAAMPWVLSIVSIPLGGVIADALARGPLGPTWGRRLVPMVGMGGSGLLISIGAHTLDPYVAAATLSIATALVMCVEGPFWAAAVGLSDGRSGSAGGIMNTGCNIGGLISPVLTPVVAAWVGWEPALHLAAALAVLAGVVWFWITPEGSAA